MIIAYWAGMLTKDWFVPGIAIREPGVSVDAPNLKAERCGHDAVASFVDCSKVEITHLQTLAA
jgi:hypothetical protein